MSNLGLIPRIAFAAGLGVAIGIGGYWASGASRPPLRPDRLTQNKRSSRRRGSERRKPSGAETKSRRTLPPLQDPTARHPLTILVVGDSLGEDLQYGLEDILNGHPHVRVVGDAVGSTGLANQAYYNWPHHLASELRSVHPNLVMVLIGGNDAVGFDYGTEPVGFGTPMWHRLYSRRVATMMTEALRAKARVIWVGLPIMSTSSVLPNSAMKTLNSIYRHEATIHPGVRYISTWRLFQPPGGGFTEYLQNSRGQVGIVRDPDGVHIAPTAGDELVASDAVRALNRWQGLNLCPNASDFWHRFDPPHCPAAPSS